MSDSGLTLPTRTFEQAKKDSAFAAMQQALVVLRTAQTNLRHWETVAEMAGSKSIPRDIRLARYHVDDAVNELAAEIETIEYEANRELIEAEERAERLNEEALASPAKTGRI